MKRIEYTAAVIRLLGICLVVTLLSQSVEIGSSVPTRVYSAFPQPALHLFGVAVMDGRSGAALLFLLKVALGASLIIYSLRLAKLFWMGILPEAPDHFRSVLRRKGPGDASREPAGDPWSDEL